MKNLSINFQGTNKVSNQAASADKAAAYSLGEILRAFATRGQGIFTQAEAADVASPCSQLLPLAVRQAEAALVAYILDKFQAEAAKSEAAVKVAAKVDKAAAEVEAADKAKAKAESESADKVAEEAKTKLQAKLKGDKVKTYQDLAKRGQATKAEIDKAKAEAADFKAKADKAQEAAEAAALAVGQAAKRLEAAKAADDKARKEYEAKIKAEVFKVAKVQHITEANCGTSLFFRRWLLKAAAATLPSVDQVFFTWKAADKAEAAEVLTCSQEARLKVGALSIEADKFPKWDKARKFEAADVFETTEAGQRRPIRLYFRDEESAALYQVVGRKDSQGQEIAVINIAVSCSRFQPLCLIDCLKYYLAPSLKAEAEAAKFEAKAAKAEVEAQAKAIAKKAEAKARKAKAQDKADKLQSSETAADLIAEAAK